MGRKILIFLFWVCTATGMAQTNLDSLRAILNSDVHDSSKTVPANLIAGYYRDTNNDSTEKYAKIALKFAEKYNQKEQVCDSYRRLGGVLRFKGDYHKALDCFVNAKEALRGTNDIIRAGKCFNNIGLSYWDLGFYSLAIEHLFISYRCAKLTGDRESVITTQINIGLIYDYQSKYEVAEKYYLKAYETSIEINDSNSIALIQNNIGYIYFKQKRYDDSERYLLHCVELARKVNSTYIQALAYNNLAALKRTNGFHAIAVTYLDSSFAIRSKNGDNFGLAMCNYNYGLWSCDEGKYEEGFEKLFLSLKQGRASGAKIVMRDCYNALSTYSAEKGEYEKAYLYRDTFYRYHDSIFNEQSRNRTLEVQADFDLEEKNRFIKLAKVDAELQLKEEEAQRNRQLLIAFFIGGFLCVVLVFLFIISRQNKFKNSANLQISKQNAEIEDINKEKISSIHYAKRIQQVLLANDALLKSSFADYFVLYEPKEIVSGDFYWAQRIDNKLYFVLGDCGSYGVPGAFLSLLHISLLKEIILARSITDPAEIARNLDSALKNVLTSLDNLGALSRVICLFDFDKRILTYYTNGTNLVACKNKKMLVPEIPVNRYESSHWKFDELDQLFLFTDGYTNQLKADQTEFIELLCSHSTLPMNNQYSELKKKIEQFRNGLQSDDILITGIRLHP